MNYNIKYQKRFVNFTEVMKQEAENAITKNIEGKMTGFREKYLQHPDAEALVKVDITRETKDDDSNGEYNGIVEVILPGAPLLRHERVYRNVEDFINNSFKQFKEQLS